MKRQIYEKTENHFVSYNNKILQKPRYQLKILWRMQLFGALCLICTKINPFNRKNISFFQGYVGSLFALNNFVNILCALLSRYSYLKKNSYHIWMNHCEHKIHHLTTTFRRNISYFVAYMWCSHRRVKNAVLQMFNAYIQFNFSWFLIKVVRWWEIPNL